MASYQGMSHYTHEVSEDYKEGWNAIFKNPGAVNDTSRKVSAGATSISSKETSRTKNTSVSARK